MDEQEQQQQNQIPPQDAPPQQRPVQNWDRSPGIKSIGGIMLILAVFAAVVFGLSMCGRVTTEQNAGGNLGSAYNIVEQRVRQAFGMNAPTTSGASTVLPQASQSQSQSTQSNSPQQQQSPQEQQAEQMQQQQQMIQQQEEIREQQREQVPSLLPENPPQPATLGEY